MERGSNLLCFNESFGVDLIEYVSVLVGAKLFVFQGTLVSE